MTALTISDEMSVNMLVSTRNTTLRPMRGASIAPPVTGSTFAVGGRSRSERYNSQPRNPASTTVHKCIGERLRHLDRLTLRRDSSGIDDRSGGVSQREAKRVRADCSL